MAFECRCSRGRQSCSRGRRRATAQGLRSLSKLVLDTFSNRLPDILIVLVAVTVGALLQSHQLDASKDVDDHWND